MIAVTKNPDESTYTIEYWDGSSASANPVFESQGVSRGSVNDQNLWVSLAFQGTQPLVVAHMERTADLHEQPWFSHSSEGGASWSAPMSMALHGGLLGNAPALAAAPSGRGAPMVIATPWGPSAAGDTTHSGPLVARSTDLTTFDSATVDLTRATWRTW